MAREWKPGDVAMVLPRGGDSLVGIRVPGGWSLETDWAAFLQDRHIETARPLVVIDPEDREQVERLARDNYDRIHTPGAFDALSAMSREVFTDFMQATLREFADPTPPKPEEPKGLGAVVEDAGGRRWVRLPIPGFDKPWADTDGVGRHVHWSQVDAITVLSDGVQP